MHHIHHHHPRRARTRYGRSGRTLRTINEAHILHAARIARLRHNGGNHAEAPDPRPDRNRQMERAFALYQGLLGVLAGSPSHARRLPISLDVLQVLYELADAERWAVEDLITRVQAVRASYLTIQDVAQYFSLSVRSVQRIVARGELRGVYSQGRLLFTEREVLRYLKAHSYSGPERVYPDEPLVPEPLPSVEWPQGGTGQISS